jgi:uracil-DNA glycosylase
MSVQKAHYPVIELNAEGVDVVKEELIEVLAKKEEGPDRRLLVSMNLVSSIHSSWYPVLLNKSFQINERLKEIYRTAYTYGFTITPSIEDTFNVFSMAIDDIKVVIVGQDPYPGFDRSTKEPYANGYAFATRSKECPGSLEKLLEAVGKQFGSIIPTNRGSPYELQGWIEQGVLLLNNTIIYTAPRISSEVKLTKKIEQAKNRAKELWPVITLEICKLIASKKPEIIFLLIGTEAHNLKQHLPRAIEIPHPSPLSRVPFNGSFFKEVRDIDWRKI